MNHMQAAFAESRNGHSRKQYDVSGEIARLVANGFHVVVSTSVDYCPSTDAIMGTQQHICSAHLLRACAEFQAGRIVDPDDGESSVAVYPLPAISAQALSLSPLDLDEDIVF